MSGSNSSARSSDRNSLSARPSGRPRAACVFSGSNGVNWRVVEGYGATIAAAGDDLPVALNCPVRRIDHSGQRLKVETAKGVITADQAIVTLPSAVLAENERLFTPLLPEKTP